MDCSLYRLDDGREIFFYSARSEQQAIRLHCQTLHGKKITAWHGDEWKVSKVSPYRRIKLCDLHLLPAEWIERAGNEPGTIGAIGHK